MIPRISVTSHNTSCFKRTTHRTDVLGYIKHMPGRLKEITHRYLGLRRDYGCLQTNLIEERGVQVSCHDSILESWGPNNLSSVEGGDKDVRLCRAAANKAYDVAKAASETPRNKVYSTAWVDTQTHTHTQSWNRRAAGPLPQLGTREVSLSSIKRGDHFYCLVLNNRKKIKALIWIES